MPRSGSAAAGPPVPRGPRMVSFRGCSRAAGGMGGAGSPGGLWGIRDRLRGRASNEGVSYTRAGPAGTTRITRSADSAGVRVIGCVCWVLASVPSSHSSRRTGVWMGGPRYVTPADASIPKLPWRRGWATGGRWRTVAESARAPGTTRAAAGKGLGLRFGFGFEVQRGATGAKERDHRETQRQGVYIHIYN